MKKYNGRQNLKQHLVNTHLGLKDGKDVTKSENSLNGETEKPDFEDLDPLTGLGDESKENSTADVSRESADIQEVDIDSIKNKNESQNGHTTSLNDSSDKENNFMEEEGEKKHSKEQTDDITIVKSSSKSKILTDREKELLGKMLNNLKKYGCAFCKER